MIKTRLKMITTATIIAVVMFTCSFNIGYGATVKVAGADIPDKYKKGYEVVNCIDISKWQSDLSADDWKKIKNAGVQAVIIRASYTSLRSFDQNIDKHFADNIVNASDAGLDVGVYHFSASLTDEEAEAEADFLLKTIEPYRDRITLPVVYDFETNQRGRFTAGKMRAMGVEACTSMCEAFLKKIEEAGYDPMIYANRSTLDNFLDHERLEKKYKVWLAQYSTTGTAPSYSGEYYMWQYSSSVRLEGIRAKFDANYIFKEDSSATAKIIPVSMYMDDEDVVNPADVANPDEGTATFSLGEGVSSEVPITSDEKKAIVTVNDKSGYVHNYELYKSPKNLQTETTLASLCSGYFISDHAINPKYMRNKVLPAVFKDYEYQLENGKTLSMAGVDNMLTRLGLTTEYYKTVGDDVYLNIKKHIAQGKPVLIWAHTNNDKWGSNKNQMMLLVGMDSNGYAIMIDPVDREWSNEDQRVKLVSVTELVDYMKNVKGETSDFTSGADGGYILIDR